MKKNKEPIISFMTDFLPLMIFFYIFKSSDAQNPLIEATIYLVATTLITMSISYIVLKKIAMMPLISALILSFFGILTFLFNNDLFIKIKPTIINLTFSLILIIGYFVKKPFLSYVLGSKIKMNNADWLSLSLRWGIFFLFLAVLNEFIWRNYSTDFWVKFKVFGMMPLSLIFTFSQMPFMLKAIKTHQDK